MSITAIILAILGLLDIFSSSVPAEFWSGLLSFVFGIWIPHPSMDTENRHHVKKHTHLDDSSDVDIQLEIKNLT
jgi:hypothetical protein